MDGKLGAGSGGGPVDGAAGLYPQAAALSGVFRRVYWFEQAAVQDHLLRLAPEDRQLRFGGGVSDSRIIDYCEQIDWIRDSVLGCWLGKELRAIGELKPCGETLFAGAEVALSVEQPWRDLDIGTELLRRIAIIARNRLIGALHLICLPRNLPMIHLVRKLHAELRIEPSEAQATLALATPTQLTLMLELLNEASGLFGSIRQAQTAA